MNQELNIRASEPKDYDIIREIVRLSFGQPAEARLIDSVRASENYLPSFDLVAEIDGVIAGHILISKIDVQTAEGMVPVLGLAPLSVSPDHQHHGIGGALVKHGIKVLQRTDFPGMFVLGEPDYYNRFGFESSSKWEIQSPYPVGEEYFMAYENGEDSLLDLAGIISYPDYFKEV